MRPPACPLRRACPIDDGAGRRRAQTRMQRKQQLGRRPVGAVDAKLQPSRSVSARISSRWRASRVSYSPRQVSARPAVIAPAPSGSRNSMRPENGKGLLDRIDDLHDMAMGAGGGELRDGRAHLARSGSTGRTGPRPRRAATVQTSGGRLGAFGRSWTIASAMPLDHVAAARSAASGRECRRARRPPPARRRARRRSPGRARRLVLRQVRRERHGGRAVGPDPDRVRGLPFLLADVEMVVAGRAAPVDAARRLARHEAADTARSSPRCRRAGGRAGRG